MSSDAFRWLPLIATLSDLYQSKQERWRFTLFFLGASSGFNPNYSSYFRVVRREDGSGLVLAGLFGSGSFPAGAREFLEGLGWEGPKNKYQSGFCLTLEQGWAFADAFWHGLAGVGALSDASSDDFFHAHLGDAKEEVVLAAFNPTKKGDYTYYHLDATAGTLDDVRLALAGAPEGPHIKPVLTAEDRASFIARHESSIPDVARWSDHMILEAETHGF